MRIRSFIPALFLVAALVLVALSYRNAPEAPMVDESSSYIPRTEAVQWMSLGHNSTAASLLWINGLVAYGESLFTGKTFRWVTHLADASTRLDSLFKTPYYFVSAITPIDEKDTSDFPVLRRGIEKYPDDWQLALSLAMRLAEGPSKNYVEAGTIMERFAADTSVPLYIRTIHKTFSLQADNADVALMIIVNDATNPRYNAYVPGLFLKACRALRLKETAPERNVVWQTMFQLAQGQLEPQAAYTRLRTLQQSR